MITRDQFTTLRDRLQPKLAYLVNLRERMERIGVPPGNRLYQLVRAAETALHAVYVEVHYLSCGSGVGKPETPGDAIPGRG